MVVGQVALAIPCVLAPSRSTPNGNTPLEGTATIVGEGGLEKVPLWALTGASPFEAVLSGPLRFGAAGTKGKRLALPHARILLHQPYGQVGGQVSDIEIQANEIEPAAPLYREGLGLDSIDALEQSTIVPRFLHPELIKNFISTKRQELRYLDELSDTEKVELYLDTV